MTIAVFKRIISRSFLIPVVRMVFLLGSGLGVVMAQVPGDTMVYHVPGKKTVHVEGCRRLTTDPAERATMSTMKLDEAAAKGLPLCSRCPGSTSPGKATPAPVGPGVQKHSVPAESDPASDETAAPSSLYPPETAVYQEAGKKRMHVQGCRRLGADLSVYAKMTYAEGEAKGLQLCSRCPGSTTPGRGNPGASPASKNEAGAPGNLPESKVNPAPAEITKRAFTPSPRAPLVSMGPEGRLVYKPYTDQGDRILDWSFCGYKRSEVPIPDILAVESLEPLPGETAQSGNLKYPMGPDSRARIQAALDKVAALLPGPDGFKGAVLLKKGTFYVDGGLKVGPGVVLRGEGEGADGTVLIGRSADSQDAFVTLGGGDGINHDQEGRSVRIVDEYVPSGSNVLNIKDASSFKVGDFVCVKKTVNQQWIDDLGMGERLRHIRGGVEGLAKKPWKPEAYQFRIIRQIAEVSGNRITLDVMLPQSFSAAHGGGEVYKVNLDQVGSHAGVESLRIVSNYDATVKDTGKDADFKNYRNGFVVENLSDGWVRNCSVLHVSLAAVQIGDDTRHITVRDCQYLQPVGPKRGGNRYAFQIVGGTLHLVYNCSAEDGRHDFAGGSRDQGPFAFVKCTAVRGGQSEPHHRWGTGFLFDSITTKDGSLAAINRGDSGTGHGWSAANTVIWNGNAQNIVVFDPETSGENNFAIGFAGEPRTDYDPSGVKYANDRAGYWGTPQEGAYYGFALMGNGHIESPDKPVEPGSLFVQQLIDRIGVEKANAVLKLPTGRL